MTTRQVFRQRRQQLPSAARQKAQLAIYRQIFEHPIINAATDIGIFLSFDGEVDTMPIINQLWQQDKRVYIPILHPFSKNHLLFIRYTPSTLLIENHYGIKEPKLDITQVIPFQELQVLFTPLVAFDDRGYRLGMGGGFYDRMLVNYDKHKILPIGLAFACQKVNKVNNKPWDIPLTEIIYA